MNISQPTYLEVQNSKEVHPNHWIPTRPHINQHQREGMSKEDETSEVGDDL
jgi:hypothetical protein